MCTKEHNYTRKHTNARTHACAKKKIQLNLNKIETINGVRSDTDKIQIAKWPRLNPIEAQSTSWAQGSQNRNSSKTPIQPDTGKNNSGTHRLQQGAN